MITSYSPIIVSASRATDIPAFYGDWLINRLKEGYVIKANPFNGKKFKIDFSETQVIVFWTKDPLPFFNKLEFLNENFPNYYFQFTLNDYDKRIEPNVPDLNKRTETFIHLSERIGKSKVIWRFDPLLLTEKLSVEDLLFKIDRIAGKIYRYTNKLVFSFADINKYRKVSKNLLKNNIKAREFTVDEKESFAKKLSELNSSYNLELSSCAEGTDLTEHNIPKNKCIDDKLILNLFPQNTELQSFLQQNKNLKDKGQRKECLCVISKDIGQYNTCIHSCVYCYANSSQELAYRNYINHNQNKKRESIV